MKRCTLSILLLAFALTVWSQEPIAANFDCPPAPLMLDEDQDGVFNESGIEDTDGDGLPNSRDNDDDGDGILTQEELNEDGTPRDSDVDGLPDYLEAGEMADNVDDDGDGIPTNEEIVLEDGNLVFPLLDTDGDGIPDIRDDDDDNDGILTIDEITDDDGNIILPYPDKDNNGIPDYKDAPNNCDEETIHAYFEEKDFLFYPIIDIRQGALRSGTISRSNSCDINDLANLEIEVINGNNEKESIDLGVVLAQICESGTQIIITKNENFCDSKDEIEILESKFNDCSKFTVWYHIFDVSNLDENSSDILVFKTNEELLYNCPNNEEEDICYTQWDIFENNSIKELPNYNYKVVQRSFGPWVDFGHFPLIPTNIPITKNNFLGDNRGFSLDEHRHSDDQNIAGVTSRTIQEYSFTLGQDKISSSQNNRGSSGTTGIKNMCPNWIPSNMPFFGPSFIKTPCDGTQPCDWDNSCKNTAIIRGLERFANNILYMHSYGRDECVDFSTNIDVRSKLVFDVTDSSNGRFLSVKGIMLNKGFPSHEMFIEDAGGNKVFLYTYGPAGESAIALPGLFPARYDNWEHINMEIKIDEDGNFKNEINVGSLDVNIGALDEHTLAIEAFLPKINLKHSPLVDLEFSFSNSSIEEWNNSHLNKNPAGDCNSIPCCGNLGCCE